MRQKRFGVDALRVALVERVNEQGLRGAARELEIDPGYLSKIVNGQKDIPETLARALGFESCPREYTRSK